MCIVFVVSFIILTFCVLWKIMLYQYQMKKIAP